MQQRERDPRPRHFLVLRSCHMSISAVTIHTTSSFACVNPSQLVQRIHWSASLQMTVRTFPIRDSQCPRLFLFILEHKEWRKKSNVPHVSAGPAGQYLADGRCTVVCHDTSLTCADRKVLDASICIFCPRPANQPCPFCGGGGCKA